MKKMSPFILLLWVSLATAVTSCGRSPDDDTIQAVTTAFNDLEGTNAQSYAANAFGVAEKVYADAMAEVEAQRGKSFLTRSYRHANELLANAKDAIERAKTRAEERRKNVERDSGTLIEHAKLSFVDLKAEVEKLKAPSTKRENIRQALEEVGASLKAAEDTYESGDFLIARAKAEEAKSLLARVSSDIKEARGGSVGD
jgi:hypothetical protein